MRTEEEDVPSTVPSIHHSPIFANVDDTVTPPAVPVNGPSSTSRSRDMPFTQHEIQMEAGQSLFGPYNFDSLYFPYPPYLPYGPYPQRRDSQHANLPKKSIFSRLKGFFRSSHSPANPQPFTAIYLQPFTQPFDWHVAVVDFTTVAFKQMYLVLLLRLPSLYFSRVARIFVQAHVFARDKEDGARDSFTRANSRI